MLASFFTGGVPGRAHTWSHTLKTDLAATSRRPPLAHRQQKCRELLHREQIPPHLWIVQTAMLQCVTPHAADHEARALPASRPSKWRLVVPLAQPRFELLGASLEEQAPLFLRHRMPLSFAQHALIRHSTRSRTDTRWTPPGRPPASVSRPAARHRYP